MSIWTDEPIKTKDIKITIEGLTPLCLPDECVKDGNPSILTASFKGKLGNFVRSYSDKKDFMAFDTSTVFPSKDGTIEIDYESNFVKQIMCKINGQDGVQFAINRHYFYGWKAQVNLSVLEWKMSTNEILNIIKLAGACCGIGKGEIRGYGRYKVVNIEECTPTI